MMLQKKVCILGATGVGKTSLIKQYVNGIFSDKYLTSIGVKIDKKIVNNIFTPTKLMIWDLEGIDRYCGFNPKYVRGASAIVIVADHTRSSSFEDALAIFNQVREHYEVPAILAINKTDLPSSAQWDENQVAQVAPNFKQIIYTSAKTGQSVEPMFTALAELSLEQ